MQDPMQSRSILRTPQHKKALDDLDDIFRSLAHAGLPIDTSQHPVSPSSRTKTAANSIHCLVRFLYFRNKPELDRIVKLYVGKLQTGALSPQDGLTGLLAVLQYARDAKIQSPNLLDKFKSVSIDSHIRPQSPPRNGPDRPIDSPLSRASFSSASTLYSSVADEPSTTANTSFATTITTSPRITRKTPQLPLEAQVTQTTTYGSEPDEAAIALLDSFDWPPPEDTSEATTDEDNLPSLESLNAQFGNSISDLETITEHQPRTQGVITSYLLRHLSSEQLVNFTMPERFYDLDYATRFLSYSTCTRDASRAGWLRSQCETIQDREKLSQTINAWLLETASNPHAVERQSEQTFRGSLVLSPKRQARSLLHFTPQPPPKEKLARLEKKFGPHRFLTVTFEWPSHDALSTLATLDRVSTFREAFNKFLQCPQKILGTTFEFFHLERVDKREKLSKKSHQDPKTIVRYRIRYFATEGAGIQDEISIYEMLNWALALEHNVRKPFHKHWARLDLHLSRTDSTVIFSPDQVRLRTVGTTTFANGSQEPTDFNDHSLDWSQQTFDPSEVMNDGCSRISPAAARSICESLNLSSPWPVMFQGRVNGAKGVWFIASPYGSHDQSRWIDISESQLKLEPNPKDLSVDTCETGKWSFELVAASGSLGSSFLYVDFLPILESRGVPRLTITEVIQKFVDRELGDLYQKIDSPKELRVWLREKFGSKELRNREGTIEQIAGFPSDTFEQVIRMLEVDFSPRSEKALGGYLTILVKSWLEQLLQKLKFESDKTAMPFGIADPIGTLEPGEICLTFSSARVDNDTGASLSDLSCEVLVARQPALRESDIQRVRAVCKPELSHLKDVVIFSSRGSVPLAKKLQGGDYDGDKFWVCWDQRLVQSFKNAPCPSSTSSLKDYGIVQDKTTLSKTWNDAKDGDARTKAMLVKATEVAQEETLLGVITIQHRRLAYSCCNLSDPKVEHLANIHDLIIDSKKNGYLWGPAEYRECMKRLDIPTNLKEATYERALRNPLETRPAPGQCKSILDELVCHHILPNAQRFYKKLETELVKNDTREEPDPALVAPYLRLKEAAADDPMAKANLQHLDKSLSAVAREWGSHFGRSEASDEYSTKIYHSALLACHALYQAIEPVLPAGAPTGEKRGHDSPSAVVEAWLEKPGPHAFSLWDAYRASALYHYRLTRASGSSARSKLAFLMAGNELCWLKATAAPGWSVLSGGMYAIYRPRKERRTAAAGRFERVREVDDDNE